MSSVVCAGVVGVRPSSDGGTALRVGDARSFTAAAGCDAACHCVIRRQSEPDYVNVMTRHQHQQLNQATVSRHRRTSTVSVTDTWRRDGAIARRKRARKIFFSVIENKSSDRKLYLIPFVLSAYYIE